MKYLIIPFFALLFLLQSNEATARGAIPFCSGCEYIEITDDLPDTEEYQLETGQYLDLAYMYKQVWVLWIPLWNYDGSYCLAVKEDDTTFYEITPDQLDDVVAENNLTLSGSPLSLWNKLGGKVIVLGLIGFGIWGSFSNDDDDYVSESEEVAED